MRRSASMTRQARPARADAGSAPDDSTQHRRAIDGLDWLWTAQLWLGVLGIAIVVAVWWLVSATGLVSTESLPSPGTVARGMGHLLANDDFRGQLLNTVWTWLITIALSSLFAVPIGVLLGYFSAMYRPAVGVVHACRSVPSSVLIPISVLLFGLGVPMKVALGAFSVVWVILLNTIYGVHGVEPQLMKVARSMRWSRLTILRRVILPSALPSVATGIRVAGGITLIVLISVEMLGASSGLGTVIVKYEENLQPNLVYASIVLTGALGIILYSALAALEKWTLPWTNASRRAS